MRPAIRALIDSTRAARGPASGAWVPAGFTYRMTPMARGIALCMCAGLSCAQIAQVLEVSMPVVHKTRRQLFRAVGVKMDHRNRLFAVRANSAIREEWNYLARGETLAVSRSHA